MLLIVFYIAVSVFMVSFTLLGILTVANNLMLLSSDFWNWLFSILIVLVPLSFFIAAVCGVIQFT
jgi:hypothetical protein